MASWLLNKLPYHDRTQPSQYNYWATLALGLPNRFKMLEVILKVYHAQPPGLGSSQLLSTAITYADPALLEWLKRAGIKRWDVEFTLWTGYTLLNRAWELERNSEPILEFLMRNGAKLVDMAEILSLCFRDQTVFPLERLKEYSKRWELKCPSSLGRQFHRRVLSTTHPFYLSDIFEWLRNPSNEFHVQFELDWMVSLLAVIFHRFLLRLLSTSKDEIEEVSSLGSLDSSYSDLISPLLSLIDRKVLNKIRLHPDECETISNHLLVILHYSIEQGLNIFDHKQCCAHMVDVGLLLNSLALVQCFASLPGHSDELTLQRAGNWNSSPEILDFISSLDSHVSEHTKESLTAKRRTEDTNRLFKFLPNENADASKTTFGMKTTATFGSAAKSLSGGAQFGKASFQAPTTPKSPGSKHTSFGFSTQASSTRTFGRPKH